ncbi:cytochrome c biogenesis protein CcsA [Glaciecola sp.]|jgi:ABC-type uncharacterized transport system permease subunit|nr:cytochrome c biogenesis protein CcsA [Glaciecola sp.]
MIVVIEIIAMIAYAIASGLLSRRFISIQGQQHTWADRIAHSWLPVVMGIGAIAAHGFLLLTLFTQLGNPDLSMVNVASLLSWLMVVTLLLTSIFMRYTILVPVSFAFAAVCVLLMLINPSSYTLTDYQAAPMVIHIMLSLSAYGCVVVALLYALQMRYIHKQLKHNPLLLTQQSLPPLLGVEAWILKLVLLGSILLALALVSGFLTIDTMLSHQHAHKTVLSIIALAVFVSLLVIHAKWGLSTTMILTLTSIGVITLTIGYFGTRIVRELILI